RPWSLPIGNSIGGGRSGGFGAGPARASRSEIILPSSAHKTAASSPSVLHWLTRPVVMTISAVPLWKISGFGSPPVVNTGRTPACGLAANSLRPRPSTRVATSIGAAVYAVLYAGGGA